MEKLYGILLPYLHLVPRSPASSHHVLPKVIVSSEKYISKFLYSFKVKLQLLGKHWIFLSFLMYLFSCFWFFFSLFPFKLFLRFFSALIFSLSKPCDEVPDQELLVIGPIVSWNLLPSFLIKRNYNWIFLLSLSGLCSRLDEWWSIIEKEKEKENGECKRTPFGTRYSSSMAREKVRLEFRLRYRSELCFLQQYYIFTLCNT